MEKLQRDRSTELALAFINNTDRHIFVTGKAGSGKTTFLRSLKKNTYKKLAIAAPTGIAAVNASGVTLHSLFQLPTSVFLPGETELRINVTAEKRLLLRELELLVIDEVSMLRADVLDAIDAVLRNVRKQPALPFGGIQLLYIGDLYQLSPIATGEELQQLKKHYSSLYFTSAKVFASANPVCISLEQIYRQTDQTFISLLNNIREGKLTEKDVELLNKYFSSGSVSGAEYVTLVTHNQSADIINAEQLSRILGEIVQIEAAINGEFDEAMYPTEKILQLKEGAQVMLLRNDRGNARKYFNGKMGIINKIQNEKLTIDFGDGEKVDIQKETWQNIRYKFDQESGIMLENTIGSFTQFPIRLAWAITIHKSQGLTFDRGILDIQKVFATGQAYVAFSRFRSLEGLILKEPVRREIINSNASSPSYLSLPSDTLADILESEKIIFLEKTIDQKLDWHRVSRFIIETNSNIVNQELNSQVYNIIKSYQTTVIKFILEIKNIADVEIKDSYTLISNRVQAACKYFLKEIDDLLEKVLAPAYNKSKGSVTQKLQHKFVKELMVLLRLKKKDIDTLRLFASGANVIAPVTKKAVKQEGKSDSILTAPSFVLELFNKGVSINEIAKQLKLNIPTVENYLASFISSGELHIRQLISEEIIDKVVSAPGISLMTLKDQFGDALTFGQIKALLNHFKLQSA